MSKYHLFIGRWQPFHKGHKALIDTVLGEGEKVLIAIRETEIDHKNPYSVEERIEMIREIYPDEKRVRIIHIPDIKGVNYGRNVGYQIREIRLHEDIEKISGTEIRAKNNNI